MTPKPRFALATCVLAVLSTVFLLHAPAFAQSTPVTLTITHAGSSSGTVGVVPSGRLCSGIAGATCMVTLNSGDAVTIVANGLSGGSNPPGVFSNGTGSAAACDKTTCDFTITADSSVTVTFDPANGPVVTMSVTLAGDGQGEVGVDNSRRQNFDPAQFSANGATYVSGSVAHIRGVAAADSRFSGFSAGTNGAAACATNASCSFVISANATVTATFHALTALSITPASASISVSRDQTFTPRGTYSNGVTENIAPGLMGTWRTKSQLNTARQSLAAAATATGIYAIGGLTGASPGTPSSAVEVFDPIANTWTTVAAMSTPRAALGAVTVSGLVYAIGGYTTGDVKVASVERYDPSSDMWTARASLAAPRSGLAVAAVNGIIYAIGGETTSGVVGTVEAYDPAANTWTPKASLTTARKFHAAAVVDGLIYVMGGSDISGNPLSSVEAYNPATDSWSAKPGLPGTRTLLAATAIDGVIYAVGGQSGGSATGSTNPFDSVFNQWSNKSFAPTSRSGLAAAALNGIVYAIGGQTSLNFNIRTTEAFTDTARWAISSPAVATINQQGRAVGVAAGQATIDLAIGSLSCAASSTCAQLTVTPNTVALDRTSLAFGSTTNGAQLTNVTPPQTVRMTQSGSGTVTWTASSNQPWLIVSPTSGSGSAIFNVSVNAHPSVLTAGNFTGAISIQLTGASTASAGPVSVSLAVQAEGASTAPFGSVDTPTDGQTNVSGSIPVTGWALDDVGVVRVRIVRVGTAAEGGGEIFIGFASIVEGARPDVATGFPGAPRGTAAGWGYLLLTNFLPNQGNGTFTLRAYADDVDGHTTLLGAKTIVCNNAAAVTPFGAVDTPGQGDTVSGDVTNFGWVLSPGTRRADPTSGGVVTVFIDGVAVGVPGGWASRSDLQTLFPAAQYSGVNNALGVFGFDSRTLSNGVHTLAWGVTDSQGGSAGVGSRYFTVSNGSGLMAGVDAAARLPLSAVRAEQSSTTPLVGRQGFDLGTAYQTSVPDPDGRVTIQSEEIDRIELQLAPRSAGYLEVRGALQPLPIGARLDSDTGIFTWTPGAGFVGTYDFVFVSDGTRRHVRIVLNPKRPGGEPGAEARR
jgi:N-acetylneuraminic acid mutarotase